MKSRESSDPYYDLIGDYSLIVSSFQAQYGIRLSKEIDTMKWDEFKDLLIGIGPEQHRIRNEWRANRAKKVTPDNMAAVLDQLKNAFISLAGGDIH